MKLVSSFQDLHIQARMISTRNLPESHGDDAEALNLLVEIESIRDAVRALMGMAGAEFATAMLLCIVAEAQNVRLLCTPGDGDDKYWFDDCANDDFLYDMIRSWFPPPSK